MAVTFNQPQQLSQSTWLITWTSDQTINAANPYRIYQDGVLISTQQSPALTVKIPPGAIPVFEVLDSITQVADIPYPAYLELGWQLDTNAAKYLVEENVAGTMTTRATLSADLTTPWQIFVTAALSDETVAKWRITPIDAAGNKGTPVTFVALMVRHPDPPNVAFIYTGSLIGTVIVGALTPMINDSGTPVVNDLGNLVYGV